MFDAVLEHVPKLTDEWAREFIEGAQRDERGFGSVVDVDLEDLERAFWAAFATVPMTLHIHGDVMHLFAFDAKNPASAVAERVFKIDMCRSSVSKKPFIDLATPDCWTMTLGSARESLNFTRFAHADAVPREELAYKVMRALYTLVLTQCATTDADGAAIMDWVARTLALRSRDAGSAFAVALAQRLLAWVSTRA